MRPLLALSLLLLALGAGATQIWLSLSDLQYPAPVCEIASRNVALQNDFGRLALSSDLLGAQLQLRFALNASQRACRFCAVRQSYCSESFGAANISGQTPLHLAQDTSYNLKLITLLDDATAASQSVLLADGQLQARLGAPGLRCGATLRLVLQAIVTAESPMQRDFLVQARDPAAGVQVNCSRELADLSCRLAPQFALIQYRVDNCVASQRGSAPLPPVVPLSAQRSYVQQYYEAVAMRDPPTRDSLRALTLCGESWLALYERARLEIYCDAEQALFVALKPWYAVALTVTALWRSGRRNTQVLIALEQLERWCAVRDDLAPALDYLANWSAAALGRDLRPLPPAQDDWATLCEWAVQLEAGPPVGMHTNVSQPWYWAHQDDWYFAPFLYVIYYNDPWMGLKAGALVALFVVCGTTALCGLAYVLFVIWRHHRQRYVVIN